MLNDRANFKEYAAELLQEMAKMAIKLDMRMLAYLLSIAVQEAVDVDAEPVN